MRTRNLSLVALALLAMACDAAHNPTAPTALEATPDPIVASAAPPPQSSVHGLPVSLDADFRAGDIGFVCATQPREYCSPAGICQKEVDHYVSSRACPDSPIE